MSAIERAAERLVDAEIAKDLALGALLVSKDDDENERCRDALKEAARELDEALIALAAMFGKTWPT